MIGVFGCEAISAHDIGFRDVVTDVADELGSEAIATDVEGDVMGVVFD